MSFLGGDRWERLATAYHHQTYHITPGPNSISYFIPFLLLPLALCIPPTALSHLQLCCIFPPIIYACQIHAWSVGGMDVLSFNPALWTFILLVLTDPRKTYRRVKEVPQSSIGKSVRNGESRIGEESYPDKLGKRIPWVLTLMVSPRLTGWRIGHSSHDNKQPPPRISRSAWMRIALGTLMRSYFILDLSFSYVQTDPYFTTSGMSVDAPLPPSGPDTPLLLVLLRLLPPRLLRSTILAGQIYAMITTMFFLPALPAVALNALGLVSDEWSPQTWPKFFGEISAIGDRGLRGLWGSWWHGIQRHMTGMHGRVLADYLQIPPRSTLRYALLVTSAFLFSGFIHMGIIPPEPQNTPMSPITMRLYVAGFFWVQIPAIGLELCLSSLATYYVPLITKWPIRKYAAVLWVAGTLCLTLPLLTVPFREMGYWREYPVPVSAVQGLAGRG